MQKIKNIQNMEEQFKSFNRNKFRNRYIISKSRKSKKQRLVSRYSSIDQNQIFVEQKLKKLKISRRKIKKIKKFQQNHTNQSNLTYQFAEKCTIKEIQTKITTSNLILTEKLVTEFYFISQKQTQLNDNTNQQEEFKVQCQQMNQLMGRNELSYPNFTNQLGSNPIMGCMFMEMIQQNYQKQYGGQLIDSKWNLISLEY